MEKTVSCTNYFTYVAVNDQITKKVDLVLKAAKKLDFVEIWNELWTDQSCFLAHDFKTPSSWLLLRWMDAIWRWQEPRKLDTLVRYEVKLEATATINIIMKNHF